MSTPDLFTQFQEAIAQRTAELVAERTSARALTADAALERIGSSIDLFRPYTAAEVGAFVGLTAKAVYGIPEAMLRPVRTGPAGGRKRYLGINVLMYVLGQEPVDTEAIGARVREQFVEQAARPPVSVRPVSGGAGQSGRRRVL